MQPLAAILASVLLAVAAMADPGPSPAIIDATCSVFAKTCAYPSHDYCVDVLSTSDPASAASAKDERDLAIIAAKATAHNVTRTVDLIDDLSHELARCSESYARGMGDKVASALGDLVAGRKPGDKLLDAYNLGPSNCTLAVMLRWGYSKDLLAHENSANAALVLLARNIARLVPNSNKTASPAAIMNSTCSSLLYNMYPGYDYCVAVLSSDDPAAAAAARSTRDLAIIAANATAHNITSTVKLIGGLLSDLAECKVSYGRMGSAVDGALGDLVAGHDAPAGAASKLGDAAGDALSCDMVMSRRRGAAKNVLHQENWQNFVSARFASNIAFLEDY
ncbi:hypothetical protein ACQJBY_016721 [Aegilops geniculata]